MTAAPFPATPLLLNLAVDLLNSSQASFTYPGATKKALTDITLHVRLSSRVAVIGANGAGKSTLIKLLTAEMNPQEGKVRVGKGMRE